MSSPRHQPAEPASIFQVLAEHAARRGDRPFLFSGEDVFTYGELETAARRLATGLEKLGVGPGDKVAILMANRPEYLTVWFALSLLGAVEAPINTAHRGDLLQHMMQLCEAQVLIVEAAYVDQVRAVRATLASLTSIVLMGDADREGLGRNVVAYGDLAGSTPLAMTPNVRPSDPGAIVFTSGTTGPSKGVLLPQAYPLRLARIIQQACDYTETDKLYNALPLFHGNAQFLSTAPALLSGAQMVLVPRFSASRFWPDVRRHGCTGFNYIGGILPILWKAEPRSDDADNPLRLVMGAGAPRDLYQPFERRFDLKIVEGYGMSEIGVPMMTTLEHRRPGACGRVIDAYEVRLVDDSGVTVDDDRPGELLIRPRTPDSMMLEYYRMPEKTVEAWRELWFHTGDYLSRDADGFFYFVDRKKDALRRRGENISSFEVERGVVSHPAILEAAAVAVASELGEDEVLICVTLRPGATLDPAALVSHCQERMADFMTPRYVRILEEMPKTPTERVRKAELRTQGITRDTYDRETDPHSVRRQKLRT